MAKPKFALENALVFAGSVLIALALTSCGTLTGAGSGAIGQAIHPSPFCVAPVEGSPEEAALANGDCSRSSWHVAPIEGSPEQTIMGSGQ